MAMDVDGEKKSSGHSAAKTKVVSNGRGTTKKMKAATGRKAKEGKKLESVDCICSKGDDGSPMILCSECKIWYVPFPFSLLPSLFFGLVFTMAAGITLLVWISLNYRRRR